MANLKQALTELYEDAALPLYGCALAVTSCGDLAEDAVHNAFVRAFRLSGIPHNLRAYMFQAVRNAAVDILRSRSRTVQPAADDFFERSAVEAPHTSSDALDLEIVFQAMGVLSDNERETILEHLVAGLSFREIAELRGRPLGTIATWYRRGLERLRTSMRSDDGWI